MIYESKNGDIITEKGDTLNRWKDLKSTEQNKGSSIMQDHKDTNEEDSAPTIEESGNGNSKIKEL